MLKVTPVAGEAIKELVPEDEAGLRFSVRNDDSQTALELSVSRPEEGDQVVTSESGAKVIMEPEAAQFLDDKVLDIRQDDDGNPSFAIGPQA